MWVWRGGEGNGGVIYPELHYGRDALIGVALFLTQLAERKISAKELRDSYPNYFISKNKIALTPEIDMDVILSALAEKYKKENNDLYNRIAELTEVEESHQRLNGKLQERLTEVEGDNKKLSVQIEHRINQLRKIGGL